MHVMAFNGSPRKKNWNTVTLLENVLAGAAEAGAETELIQLYDMHVTGCISCFSCKQINRKQDGVCAIRDELTTILKRVRTADALIIGSPVYYGAETAATRALIERLCFPYNRYAKDRKSLFPKRINTAMVYTMNVTEEQMKTLGYDHHMRLTQGALERTFGSCELLVATDTMQYSNYDEYEHELFNKENKVLRHETVFPEDCKKAFDLGRKLVNADK